nr:ribonuclease H-like domain-containing protein [Tanacetum cinerariifolium]
MIQPEPERSTQDIPLDSVEVFRYDKKSKVRLREKVPTKMELVLEQTQQDVSNAKGATATAGSVLSIKEQVSNVEDNDNFTSLVAKIRTDKGNVVGANTSDTMNTNSVTMNPSKAAVCGHNLVHIEDDQTSKKQGSLANIWVSTSRCNTNKMATTSSNNGPENSDNINMVSLRSSFAALNEQDKVFENVDMTKERNEATLLWMCQRLWMRVRVMLTTYTTRLLNSWHKVTLKLLMLNGLIVKIEEYHRAVVTGLGAGPSHRARSSLFNSSVNNMSGVQRSQTSGNTPRPNNFSRPNNNGNRMTASGPTLVYKNYGFNDHTIDRCFKIIRYPSDFGKKNNGNQNFNKRITVSHPNGTEALITKGKSPYELVFNKKAFFKTFKVFSCLCFATNLNNHDKFSSRAEKCVLIGYSSFKKGYKLFSLDLDHVNLFNEIFHEGRNTSYDNNDLNARDQSDGRNSSNLSSPTIDLFEDDMGHP